MTFVLSSLAKVNCVILVSSVGVQDERRLEAFRDSLAPILSAEQCPFLEFRVTSDVDLQDCLDKIAERSEAGLSPILQLLMHGDEHQGLICADGSTVPWNEVHAKLRKINYFTGNNLVVISAACHSFSLLKGISITVSSPFYLLIAPEKEAEMDFVEDKTKLFYLDVFRGEDIVISFERHLRANFNIIHSEALLFVSICRYFRESCMGQDAAKRREDLITAGSKSGGITNRNQLRASRSIAKRMIKPNQGVLDRFRGMFLLGKKVSFDFRDAEKIARISEDAEHAEALAQLKLTKRTRKH